MCVCLVASDASGGQGRQQSHPKNAVGPFGAILHHLAQVGWSMSPPHLMVDAEGEEYDLTKVSPQWIAERVRWDAQQKAWKDTTDTRRDAGGAEWGVDELSLRTSVKKAKASSPEWGHLAEKMARGGGGPPAQGGQGGHGRVLLL